MNCPATFDVALSWVELRAVPYAIAAGVGHEIVGVALFTVNVTVLLIAVPAKFVTVAYICAPFCAVVVCAIEYEFEFVPTLVPFINH